MSLIAVIVVNIANWNTKTGFCKSNLEPVQTWEVLRLQ